MATSTHIDINRNIVLLTYLIYQCNYLFTCNQRPHHGTTRPSTVVFFSRYVPVRRYGANSLKPVNTVRNIRILYKKKNKMDHSIDQLWDLRFIHHYPAPQINATTLIPSGLTCKPGGTNITVARNRQFIFVLYRHRLSNDKLLENGLNKNP